MADGPGLSVVVVEAGVVVVVECQRRVRCRGEDKEEEVNGAGSTRRTGAHAQRLSIR